MSPVNLKKISDPELETSTVNIISVRNQSNEQTDRPMTNLKLFSTCVQTSPEYIQKDSSSRTGVIMEWGNEWIDRHTRNLKLFRTSLQTSQECPQ